MSESAAAETSLKFVPFNSIEVDPGFNIRTVYNQKKIDELIESIRNHGLLTPLMVRPNGDEKYHLVSGHNRQMAMKALRYGSREVPVVVKEFKTEKEAYLANAAENTGREDVSSFDQAKRFFEMEEGIPVGDQDGAKRRRGSPDAEGGVSEGEDEAREVVSFTRKEIAEATALSISHIGNLVRAWRDLSDESKKAWRKHELALSFVFSISKMTHEEQETAIEEYLAEEEKGKKRKKKAAGGDDEEGGGKASAKDIKNLLEVLYGKVENHEDGSQKLSKVEKAYLDGKIQALRFAIGAIGARGVTPTKYE